MAHQHSIDHTVPNTHLKCKLHGGQESYKTHVDMGVKLGICYFTSRICKSTPDINTAKMTPQKTENQSLHGIVAIKS